MPIHMNLESNSKDEFFISNALEIPLPLPPLVPFDDYESMAPKYNNKKSYDITIIEKTNKLVSGLALTLLIFKMVENLVIKSTPALGG